MLKKAKNIKHRAQSELLCGLVLSMLILLTLQLCYPEDRFQIKVLS